MKRSGGSNRGGETKGELVCARKEGIWGGEVEVRSQEDKEERWKSREEKCGEELGVSGIRMRGKGEVPGEEGKVSKEHRTSEGQR